MPRFLVCITIAVASFADFSIAATTAPSTLPTSESFPAGIRFLERADTLSQLVEASRPTLHWQDDGETPLFMWMRPFGHDPIWLFTVDRAYHLREDQHDFWAFVDHKSVDGAPPLSAIWQFFAQHQTREEVTYPSKYTPDGNYSRAELIGQGNGGENVFRIIYVSGYGGRSNQEEIFTLIVYVPSDGSPMYAGRGPSHEGLFTGAWDNLAQMSEMTVVWHDVGATTPFHIKFVQLTMHSAPNCGDMAPIRDYTCRQEGVLEGDFPLTCRFLPGQFVESDGQETLSSLAKTLCTYWTLRPDELTAEGQRATYRLWLQELIELNPNLGEEKRVPVRTRIAIPDESQANNRIWSQMKPSYRK